MRTKCLCLLILAVLLLCAGCADTPEETEPTYAYTEAYQRIQEPYASGFAFQGNLMQTMANERTYEFDPAISQEERDSFVTGQEALCAFLEEKGISTTGLTFRVLADYTNWSDSENRTAYFNLASAGSWEQALTTLQAALGDYTNYGYLYALADLTAAELGWEQEEFSGAGQLTGTLLNLVYPCFDEAYTTPEEIAACKAASKEILAGLENPWSEDAFLEARLDYAQTHNLDFEPTYIIFAYYSPSCPLKLQTKYLEVFKDSTYVQDYYVTVGRILEDYFVSLQKIMETFQWLDEQLAKLRSLFQVDEEELVPVQLKEDAGANGNLTFLGLFVHEGNSNNIYAESLHCLAHEYIHYLYCLRGGTQDPAYEDWLNEIVACYYAAPETFELHYLLGANSDPDYLEAVEALIGEDYDDTTDYIKFTRKVFRRWEIDQYEYYIKTEYTLRPAFGEYFVRTYGEDVFLDCMLAPSTIEERTGKTLEEIVDDWCVDVADPAKDDLVQYTGPL